MFSYQEDSVTTFHLRAILFILFNYIANIPLFPQLNSGLFLKDHKFKIILTVGRIIVTTKLVLLQMTMTWTFSFCPSRSTVPPFPLCSVPLKRTSVNYNIRLRCPLLSSWVWPKRSTEQEGDGREGGREGMKVGRTVWNHELFPQLPHFGVKLPVVVPGSFTVSIFVTSIFTANIFPS